LLLLFDLERRAEVLSPTGSGHWRLFPPVKLTLINRSAGTLITSANDDMQSSLIVRLSVWRVSNFARKLPNRFAWNFQGRLAIGQWTND